MPPRRLIDGIVGGDFKNTGQEFLRYFVELGGLRATDRVLDVGCGCGRMAVPLMPFLADSGEYWGFDIVWRGVEWCQKNIAANDARFHFQLADVYNPAYHRKGKYPAHKYRFPYQDGFFDFVFLTSIFTHMSAAEMENYLAEISRVLKPEGRCLVSFFLLNPESRDFVRRGQSKIDFKHEFPNGATSNPRLPEKAIAFDEAFVRSCFEREHLKLIDPIRYGSWCGRTCFVSFQDLLVAAKSNGLER